MKKSVDLGRRFHSIDDLLTAMYTVLMAEGYEQGRYAESGEVEIYGKKFSIRLTCAPEPTNEAKP